jgi:hypothetical protein
MPFRKNTLILENYFGFTDANFVIIYSHNIELKLCSLCPLTTNNQRHLDA